MFINIAREIDRAMPGNQGWHREILGQMTLDIPVIRPAVIGPELASRLQQYLSFRYRFRNLYGYDLEWAKMEELINNMEFTLKQLKESMETFLETLGHIVE